MKKEYKYTINGNKYEVAIGEIVENEVTVTVNGEEYKVEMEPEPRRAGEEGGGSQTRRSQPQHL